jgi:hypothetical protein
MLVEVSNKTKLLTPDFCSQVSRFWGQTVDSSTPLSCLGCDEYKNGEERVIIIYFRRRWGGSVGSMCIILQNGPLFYVIMNNKL